MRLKICKLDLTKFLSVPGLVWQAAFKNTNVKLDLLTDIDVLLMVEKDITGEMCHSIYYDKNKKSSYIQYWDVDNLYG